MDDEMIKNFYKYVPADFREMCNNYASADTSTRIKVDILLEPSKSAEFLQIIAESIKVKEKLDKEGEQK
jgi:hypothetical protein